MNNKNSDKLEEEKGGLPKGELIKKENVESSEPENLFDGDDIPPKMRQEIHKFFSMMVLKSSGGFP